MHRKKEYVAVNSLVRFVIAAITTLSLTLSTILIAPSMILAEPSSDTPKPVSGRPVSLTGILSADVLARTELLREELELIRFEMGKPKDSWTGGIATNAYPHEVYFQALTLFLKANRLSLELTGSTGVQPEIMPALAIRPFHVWMMVNAAYDRILAVKQELGITQSTSEQPKEPSTTPTDSGRAVVQANRQINLLLERPFSPSDVFHQVTLAIHYAATLLEQFRGVTTIPDAHPFEPGKQPAEVFLRLVDCYERLEAVAKHSQVQALHLDRGAAIRAANRNDFHPSDVYDIATLLVSDLAFLHAQTKNLEPPVPATYPGRKFPSHVYQQVGILYEQLVTLEERVKADPEWLKN